MPGIGSYVDCLHGDFIVDLTPCAPNGGFGLSAPTGAGDLVEVTQSWQQAADHMGGVVGHFISADEVYFSTNYGGDFPDLKTSDTTWAFIIQDQVNFRPLHDLSGPARLWRLGKPDIDYLCKHLPRL
jgi:hypothetical protein